MKLVISPAKLMDLKSEVKILKKSEPQFIKNTKKLHQILVEKNPKFFIDLMKISPKLADENWDRFQKWKANPAEEESIQAVLAFKGEVYRGLDVQTLDAKHYDSLQSNLIILSGYYGLLRPFDTIMPYRLEMGRALKVGANKNLYEFWKKEITNTFLSSLKEEEPIINLASKEYFKVIDKKAIENPIVEVDFKEERNGELKSIMSYFKNARGKMARFCIENELQKVEDLKQFTLDNYKIEESLSNQNHLVFVR